MTAEYLPGRSEFSLAGKISIIFIIVYISYSELHKWYIFTEMTHASYWARVCSSLCL